MGQASGKEYWVVCPVCLKANPAGTEYCKYCWGASLGSQTPVPEEELERVIQSAKRNLRRRKITRRAVIIGGSGLLAILAALWFVFSYTDVLVPVRQNLNSNSQPGQWSMFRHDFRNSGVVGQTGITPDNSLQWSFQTGSQIHSSAAYSNGTIFFGSQNGNLYALDAKTGVEKWRFHTNSFVDSSPAVVDGVVYVGSNDGHIYAVDAATGQEIWKFKTPYPVTSSPAVADGKIFFGADDYHIYALNAKNGTKIWSFRTGGPVSASPVVKDGLVFFGSGVQYAYVLNASNGRPRLRFKMYDSSYGAPAISGSTVYQGNYRGDIYVFDGSTRNWLLEYELKPLWIQIWAFGLAPAPPVQSGFLWGLKTRQPISTSIVSSARGDQIFLGAGSNLLSVDTVTRKVAWKFTTGGNVRSSPALLDTMVLFGSNDGKLYAVNYNGEKIWDFPTGAAISSSPIVIDGVIYFGSHDGKFYALK